MKAESGGGSLQRLLQGLAEAETALTGPGPQAVRQAVEILTSLEDVLRCEAALTGPAHRENLADVHARLQRIGRMVEFGAAYWSGLVACSVAAEAYGPGANSYPEPAPGRMGDLHG